MGFGPVSVPTCPIFEALWNFKWVKQAKMLKALGRVKDRGWVVVPCVCHADCHAAITEHQLYVRLASVCCGCKVHEGHMIGQIHTSDGERACSELWFR